MGALGVAHHFEAIFDIVASDYRPKPERTGYDKFVANHNVDPNRAVMVEDMACNLAPAHEMGMTCVWIKSDNDWAKASHDGERESQPQVVVPSMFNSLSISRSFHCYVKL